MTKFKYFNISKRSKPSGKLPAVVPNVNVQSAELDAVVAETSDDSLAT